MFPDNFIENTIVENEVENVGVDFLFDYETGQHLIEKSVLKECNTVKSVEQFIQNVLRTKVNAYKVYTEGETETFGISVYNYLGQRVLPMGYVNSELKREVTEQLLKHPLINEVKDWTGKREKRSLNISFTTVLKDGTLLETSENVGGLNI